MDQTYTITNLSNAIRFYNLLLDQRPRELSYAHARYDLGPFQLLLHEGVRIDAGQMRPNNLVVSTDRFLSLYRKMQQYATASWPTECQILEDRFTVSDPDGYAWVVSKSPVAEGQPHTEGGHCYLEPLDF